MKKVIVCLLLLIPILVILTIDASSRLIVSASVEIAAESIIIKHEGVEIKSDEIDMDDYLDNKRLGFSYTLFCEVFPVIATDEITWTSSNPAIAEVFKEEKRDNAARVEFYDYGSVDIICTSKKNTSITAMVTLYIDGKTLNRITIGDQQGEEYSACVLDLYETKNYFALATPAKSVLGEAYNWSVADESIATVDRNGVVTALKTGQTELTVSIQGKSKTVPLTVIDTDKKGFTQGVIYTTAPHLDLSPYLRDGWTIESGNEVTLSSERTIVEAVKSDRRDTVTVVRLSNEKTLLVKNYFALVGEGGALSSPIALNSANFFLDAYAFDGSTPAVTWSSSDESVIRMDGNQVIAVGRGSAEVYPTAFGYEGQKVVIEVCKAVESFRLADAKDKLGLMQEKVYANQTYKNGRYTYQYPITFSSSYPADVGAESFTYYTSDESVATVNARGVITFADDVEGKEVKISVVAYNHNGLRVEESLLFRMVNGVNIGVGVEQKPFDKSKGEEPNFSVYQDFKQVSADRSVAAIVLHADVYYPSKARGGETIMNPSASLYGNGNKLDGQFFIDSVEETEKLILWDFSTYEKMPALDLKYYNIRFQAKQPVSDEAQEAFAELNAKGGGALATLGGYPEGGSFALTLKGCLFQYAYGHVNFAIGDIFIDGCIFRNNSASAIVLQQSSYGVANMRIRNSIFSHTIAPVAIVCGNFNDILKGTGKDTKVFGTFALEGTNYVYNWKKLEDVQMNLLPQGLVNETASGWVDQCNGVLTRVIREAFDPTASDPGNLYLDENGDDWLNFSFLLIGIWLNLDPSFNVDGAPKSGLSVTFDLDKYACYEVETGLSPSVSAMAPFAAGLGFDLSVNRTYHIVSKDPYDNFTTMPGEEYVIDDGTCARLRGE